MGNKKISTYIFGIIVIILGWTLFKQFDFENLKFEKPALAIVYIITFLASAFFLVKNLREK